MNIPETLKMPYLSGLGKRPQGRLRNQRNAVSLILSLVFKTVFEMFLAHLVCLKSVRKDMFVVIISKIELRGFC
jgi:hypothetical protein